MPVDLVTPTFLHAVVIHFGRSSQDAYGSIEPFEEDGSQQHNVFPLRLSPDESETRRIFAAVYDDLRKLAGIAVKVGFDTPQFAAKRVVLQQAIRRVEEACLRDRGCEI